MSIFNMASGGGGQIKVAEVTLSSSSTTLGFGPLSGRPKAFGLTYGGSTSFTSSNEGYVTSAVYDGTNTYGSFIYNNTLIGESRKMKSTQDIPIINWEYNGGALTFETENYYPSSSAYTASSVKFGVGTYYLVYVV